jgi:uncharacterized caspase-like protein
MAAAPCIAEGMVGFARSIAVAWLALVCALAPAHAEKRVALVIGNAAYVNADRLANPVNDARGMRDALTALKFDVMYGEDLDGKALRKMISRFASHVDGADAAVVYFAGHGATFGDISYVVPIDAEFSNLDDMPAELVAVEDLISDLRRAKTVRIAILDACRDDAAELALKKSRGGPPSRGLAPPKNPNGLIIAYATQHGATAADSAGSANSPFTAALLHNIATPGLDVTDMFRKVGREVNDATGGRQRPEISVSIYEAYALAPAGTAPAASQSATGGAEPAPPAAPALRQPAAATALAAATPPDTLQDPKPSASQKRAMNFSGNWIDTQVASSKIQVTQNGSVFSVTGNAVGEDPPIVGIGFVMSGNGRITGTSFDLSYTAKFQNGVSVAGHCTGVLRREGVIAWRCKDNNSIEYRSTWIRE